MSPGGQPNPWDPGQIGKIMVYLLEIDSGLLLEMFKRADRVRMHPNYKYYATVGHGTPKEFGTVSERLKMFSTAAVRKGLSPKDRFQITCILMNILYIFSTFSWFVASGFGLHALDLPST